MNVMNKLILHIIFVLVLTGYNCFATDSTWPKMKEFDDSFVVDTKAEGTEFVKSLCDLTGTVRYVFVCRGGTDEYLDKRTDITYVGPLGCRLSEGNKEVETSLLSEDDGAPWHSRGQYVYESLLGDCGKYPEYGRVRHFRLRGFELTLTVADLVTNDRNQIVSFGMKVALRRDDRITSRQAEQPGYLPPRGDCKTVKKGNLPRMCRYPETGFIWEQCKD